MQPKKHLRLIWTTLFIITLVLCFLFLRGHVNAPSWTFLSNSDDAAEAPAPSFNKQQFSLDDPASLWFIVNKQRPAPANYSPGGLRQPQIRVRSSGSSEMLLRDEAASAVEQLVAGASSQGINLMLVSGYRSYGLQQSVYGGNVSRQGRAEADKTSARPGHSEHQTGLAADLGTTSGLCQLDTCFSQTPEGRWLADHAHEYGFVVRYPDGQEGVTGYTYEPWHIRFVGKELAAEVHKTGQILEPFFGLPNAPNY